MRELVLHLINISQGISNTDLTLKAMAEVGPFQFDKDRFELTIAQLINGKEIIEVEFVLPQYSYRTQAIYFPKGTRLGINNGKGL